MIGSLADNSLAAVASAGSGNLLAVGAQETKGHCCLHTLASALPRADPLRFRHAGR
jgi:hypothetical protein